MTSPERPFRILYAGNNLALFKFISDSLSDCFVVRCPDKLTARTLIKGMNYSLLLFDDELLDIELESFSRSRRSCTPVLIYRKEDDFNQLVESIIRQLPG